MLVLFAARMFKCVHTSITTCQSVCKLFKHQQRAGLHLCTQTPFYSIQPTTWSMFIFPLRKEKKKKSFDTASHGSWQMHPHRHTSSFTSLLVCMHTTLSITAKELVYTALFSHPEWTDGPPLWMALTESIFSAQPHRKAECWYQTWHPSLSPASSFFTAWIQSCSNWTYLDASVTCGPTALWRGHRWSFYDMDWVTLLQCELLCGSDSEFSMCFAPESPVMEWIDLIWQQL